jgi:signal transduction histidine kinase
MAQGLARTRLLLVIFLQLAILVLLAGRGFPVARVLIHAAICLFYLVACRCPAFPIAEQTKRRLLAFALLSYGGWIANTGGLMSPLVPLGLGVVLPALLVFDTGPQKVFFFVLAAVVLIGVVVVTATPFGHLLPPLAPVAGRPSVDYLVIAAASILVTVVNISGFWGMVTAAYAKVAMELGNRREELCSAGEDRVRELEGAAANLAHEMKNPLASIKALSAHLARCSTLDARTVKRLEVVSTEADRLESIVDSFISLSHGLGELHLEPVRPYAIALELKLLLDERAAQAGVAIDVLGGPDAEIVADARKLQRALFYLTMNAVQASAPGQTVTVQVRPGASADTLAVQVIDRGKGMCHVTLERLQRPPFSTKKGGSGLGVAVARALVNQHGGQLRYESVPRQGTTVTIELPRLAAQRQPKLNLFPAEQANTAHPG